MSMIQCADCSLWIDPKECPETYREELDKWLCDRCWEEKEHDTVDRADIGHEE